MESSEERTAFDRQVLEVDASGLQSELETKLEIFAVCSRRSSV
jgi:hypothetical protein